MMIIGRISTRTCEYGSIQTPVDGWKFRVKRNDDIVCVLYLLLAFYEYLFSCMIHQSKHDTWNHQSQIIATRGVRVLYKTKCTLHKQRFSRILGRLSRSTVSFFAANFINFPRIHTDRFCAIYLSILSVDRYCSFLAIHDFWWGAC